MACLSQNGKQHIIKALTGLYVLADFYLFHSIASFINSQYSTQCTDWAKEEGNSFVSMLEESQKEGVCWVAGTVSEAVFAGAAYYIAVNTYQPIMTVLGNCLIGQLATPDIELDEVA